MADDAAVEETTTYTPKTVKDVESHEFVRQYAKHLKSKVRERKRERYLRSLRTLRQHSRSEITRDTLASTHRRHDARPARASP